MVSQSCGSIECLVATLVGAIYSLLKGRIWLSCWSWGERGDRGIRLLLGIRILLSIIFSIVFGDCIIIIELFIFVIVL